MEIKAKCKECGATWRLVGAEYPAEDPKVLLCPHCDLGCMLAKRILTSEEKERIEKAVQESVAKRAETTAGIGVSIGQLAKPLQIPTDAIDGLVPRVL